MSDDVKTVSTDFMSMFKWSWDSMMANSKIWLYPVAVSFIQGLFTTLIAFYIFMLGPSAFFILPILATFEFLLNIAFLVIIFFLVLISVKMFVQSFEGVSPDFESAKNEILSNPGGYILVGIISAIISLFVITIPIALLLLVVAVMIGPSDLGKAFSMVFSILSRNLVTVILLSIVAIILDIIAVSISSMGLTLGFASIVLSPLSTFIDVLILGAFTYLTLEAVGYGEKQEVSDEV